MKKHLGMVLCLALVLSISTPVLAAETVLTEQELAADYLAGHNIMVGDQNGALHLESKLTRAELAAVLCWLCVNQRHVEADRELYEEKCVFSDVPAWSRVYVGWCAFSGLMGGYGGGRFGGYDPVTNAAACTTVLRYLGYSETPWDYDTACETAFRLGLTDETLAPGSVITRGELAVMIYRALDGRKLPEAHEDRQSLTRNEDGSLNLSSDGSQYIPQAGDVIRCDDGTNYTITDVSAYDSNFFADGPLGPLPEPTCDWSLLDQPELPAPEARRFQNVAGDNLRVRNLYETRRMLYTLYNAIGDNSATWANGTALLRGDGEPLVQIELSIPDGMRYYMFWPWRASEIQDLFHSRPIGTFWLEAWDVYKDGVFLHTEYDLYSR